MKNMSTEAQKQFVHMKEFKTQTILKRISAVLISIVILPFVFYGIFLLTVPISRPDKAVRSYVMKKIPVGTNRNEAIEIINSKGWEIDHIAECGLFINDAAGSVSYADEWTLNLYQNDPFYQNQNKRRVGSKSMKVYLGNYYGPLYTSVKAYIAFDEKEKLIEVFIMREIDGI